MGLNLTAEDIAALETRTEGWIAGLQLAALALQATPRVQGHQNASAFIRSFTGSHHFILDYLLEEVLQRQPDSVQSFLLRTSILDRLCGPLCDAVCALGATAPGQETLQHLERTNLFIVPLDNERHWYRYHRLFADLLRQRLLQNAAALQGDGGSVYGLHRRAAFGLRTTAWRTKHFGTRSRPRIMSGQRAIAELAWPSTFRNYIQNTLFLRWMKALPDEVIRARPVLSTGYAWALLDVGELEAAESRLRDAERWLDPQGSWIEGPEAAAMAFADPEELRYLPGDHRARACLRCGGFRRCARHRPTSAAGACPAARGRLFRAAGGGALASGVAYGEKRRSSTLPPTGQ